jgi:hypothetical protein
MKKINARVVSRLVVLVLLCACTPELFAADSKQADIRELDRFFTTRAERAELDAMRRSGGSISYSPATGNSRAAPQVIEMKGIMQRERGAPVVWVNEGNTLNSERIDDQISVRAENIGNKSAVINNSGHAIRLKPGQVWQPDTNTVEEKYRTSVTAPVTKGADSETVAAQTETGAVDATPAAPKAETGNTDTGQPKP